ncbi:MAG: cupredoxin domain-containing protein [Acidobacteriia bacterium]|nr:cupredoxin domain-containing protein [Terriglobia bacterium]
MNRRLVTRIVLAALAFGALAILASPVPRAQEDANTVEIKMTAKKYRFDPNEITVKKGQHVKLLITALDRDHGFKLEAFNINQKLKKGETETIEFTADKTGTFPFQCSEFCGLGHGKMKGKLVVGE